MNEKRGSPRLRTFKGGSILFGVAPAIDCIVRNLSDTGACVQIADRKSIGVPDDFTLLLKPELKKRNCHVVWRSADRIGVEFTD